MRGEACSPGSCPGTHGPIQTFVLCDGIKPATGCGLRSAINFSMMSEMELTLDQKLQQEAAANHSFPALTPTPTPLIHYKILMLLPWTGGSTN